MYSRKKLERRTCVPSMLFLRKLINQLFNSFKGQLLTTYLNNITACKQPKLIGSLLFVYTTFWADLAKTTLDKKRSEVCIAFPVVVTPKTFVSGELSVAPNSGFILDNLKKGSLTKTVIFQGLLFKTLS